jgi:uncharacterized protein (DUF362 family)
MIAEINSHYNLDFVLMDGIKAFISGGQKKAWWLNLTFLPAKTELQSCRRVAILKMYGAKIKVGEEDIFKQDQLKGQLSWVLVLNQRKNP